MPSEHTGAEADGTVGTKTRGRRVRWAHAEQSTSNRADRPGVRSGYGPVPGVRGADADHDAHCLSHANRNACSDANSFTYCYGDTRSHTHSNGNLHSTPHAYAYAYSNRGAYSYSHGGPNPYSDAPPNSNASSDPYQRRSCRPATCGNSTLVQ